jgi:hypothetical protein
MSTSAVKTKATAGKPTEAKPAEKVETPPAEAIATPAPPVAPAKTPASRNNLALLVAGIVLLEGLLLATLIFGVFPRMEKGPLLWAASLFPLFALGFLAWFIARPPAVVAEAKPLLKEVTPLSVQEQRAKFDKELAAFAQEAIAGTGYQPDEATLQEMTTTYLVAGDLALRRLELEHPGGLRRNVAVADTPFDAAFAEGDRLFAVEVKLAPTGDLRPEILGSVLERAEQTARRLRRAAPDKKFTLVLLLVASLPPPELKALREKMLGRLGAAPVELDLIIYDYNELFRLFARELVF